MKLVRSIGEERHRYETRSPHGPYPAGTSCWASRKNGELLLEFEDGVQIKPGAKYYLEGLEVTEKTIFERMRDAEIAQADDAIFLAM